MPAPTMIDFAYLRRRTWFPDVGLGARTGRGCEVPTVATAAIRTVSGHDAPVAAVLSTVAGPTVTARNLDGALLRPVRNPGSWVPCVVPDFRAAARGLSPWHDSPFVFDGETVTRNARVPHDANGRWAPDEADATLAGVMGRMSQLVVVDGVVHEPMRLPCLTLRTVSVTFDDASLATDWRDDPRHDGSTRFGEARGILGDHFMGTAVEEGGPGHACATFGLDREEDAHRVGAEWARRRGAAYLRRQIVLDLDAGLLPRSETVDPLLGMARELALSFGDGSWTAIHGQPRRVVEDWLDLRDMAERVVEAPDADTLRAAFDRLADLVDQVFGPDDGSHTALNRLTVRWRHAESRLDLTLVPGLDDEALSNLPRF